MTPVVIDFETRARVDLKRTGGHAYVADEGTEVLGGAALVDDTVFAWSRWYFEPFDPTPLCPVPVAPLALATFYGDDAPPRLVIEAARGRGAVAHNGQSFDRPVWEALGLPEVRWFDSLPRARRRGLPGKLEQLGQLLYGQGKDAAGHRLMLLYSRPKRGKLLTPVPAIFTQVMRYCVRDVLLLACLWEDERLGAPHPDDAVLELDALVNRRGVRVDRDFLACLREAERKHALAAFARAADHGVTETMLRSPKALVPWFRAHGCRIGDVRAETMEWVRDGKAPAHFDGPAARAVAAARLEAVRVTAGKIAAAEAWQVDGRLRGLLAYWGAHTGRWAGRGPQVQNLPRPPAGMPADLHPAEAAAWSEQAKVPLAHTLGALLRHAIVPDPGKLLAVADYAQVEARCVLWIAGDPTLEEFARLDAADDALHAATDDAERKRWKDERARWDPYRRQAAALYEVLVERVTKDQRALGKLVVLGMGYGGGVGALERSAGKSRLDLATCGIAPEAAVEGWRDSHPAVAGTRTGGAWTDEAGVVRFARKGGAWRRLLRCVRRAVEDGRPQHHAGCRFEREGTSLVITLPSGRPLVYRKCRLESQVPKWGGKARPVVVWDSPRGRRSLWHGLLMENLSQSICRDLMTDAMLRCEAAGYPVLLSVHDELVCQVSDPGQLGAILGIMRAGPAWAAGFPIGAEGHVSNRYTK